MKKITAVLLSTLMLASAVFATGCSNGVDPSSLVAKITSEVENSSSMNISLKTFNKEYNTYINKYGIDPEDEKYAAELEETRDSIISFLMQEQWMLRAGEEAGISADTLTSTDTDTINDNFDEAMQSYYDGFKSKAITLLGTDYTDAELLAKEKELAQELFIKSGITEDDILTWERNDYLREKVMDALVADVTATDEEIKSAYDGLVEEAKSTFDKTPSDYESSSVYPYYYIPEGTRVIEQILIAIDTTDIYSIMEYRDDEDDASADKLRDEKLATIKEEAEKVLALVNDGQDFSELVSTYSDDTGKTSYPDGYNIIPNSVSFPEEMVDAAFKLEKKGDVTGLVACDYGYVILKYSSDYVHTEEDKTTAQEYAEQVAVNKNKTARAQELYLEWQKKYAYTINYSLINVTADYQTFPNGTAAGAVTEDDDDEG